MSAFQFFSSASFFMLLFILFFFRFSILSSFYFDIYNIHPSIHSSIHYYNSQADFLSINSGFSIWFFVLGCGRKIYIYTTHTVYEYSREWNEMPFAWNEFHSTVMCGIHFSKLNGICTTNIQKKYTGLHIVNTIRYM